jgi:hypothetical protein
MGQIVSDDFNRSDSTGLGSNWTSVLQHFDIVSNQAKTTLSGDNQNVFTGASWTGGNDQYAEAAAITKVAFGDFGPIVRASSSAETFYYFAIDTSDTSSLLGSSITCGILKAVGGSFSTLGSTSAFVINVNDVVTIEANGTSLQIKVNGVVKIGPVTDSAIASGNPGLFGFNSGNIFDNFAAGDFSAAPSNIASAIGWRNRQNPRLRGPIKQSRFQRTQLWSTAAPGSTVNGNGASASSFVTVGQLSGVGNLTGASAMTIQSAGSGSGTGAMSGASSVTINTRAAGSGNGALTGASSVTINTRAAGSGKGALTGAASVTINTSGAGSGKAALAGQSTFTISTGGTLTSSAIGSMIGRSVFGFAARVSGAGLANMTGNSAISESSAAAGSGKAAMTGRSTFSFAPQIFLQALTPISGRSQMNLVLRGLMTGLTPPKPSWLELPLSNAYRANEISSTPRDNRIESEYRDNRITTEEAK